MPTKKRISRAGTAGSARVASYVERHNVRKVSVYLTENLHRALSSIAEESGVSLQGLITLACAKHYGPRPKVPPILPPTSPTKEPHKNLTWYADRQLHTSMRLLSVHMDVSVQRLIVSALVDYFKDYSSIQDVVNELAESAEV